MSRIYYTGFESGDIGLFSSVDARGANFTNVRVLSNAEIPSIPEYEDHTPPKYGDKVLSISYLRGVVFHPEIITGQKDHTELYLSFKIQFVGDENICSNKIFAIQDSEGHNHVFLEDDGDYTGALLLACGYQSDKNHFIPHTIRPYEWTLIELYYKLSTTRYTYDGEFEFRINGRTLAEATNFRTNYSPTADLGMREVYLLGGSSEDSIFDDFILDSTAAFETSGGGIVRYQPDSDQTSTWTPSVGGNHYEIADNKSYMRDMPENDYLATDSATEESFGVAQDGTSAIGATSTIFSVQTEHFISKVGAPAVNQIKPFLDVSGNKYFGVEQRSPLNNFYPLVDIWESNPDTSADWTGTEIPNVKLGIKAET